MDLEKAKLILTTRVTEKDLQMLAPDIAQAILTIQGYERNARLTTKEINESDVDKIVANLTPSEIFTKMDESCKDGLYRMLWSDYVHRDVVLYSQELNKRISDDCVEEVVNRYVYNGDYDCNLSYWVNLETLIDEVSKDEEYHRQFEESEELE